MTANLPTVEALRKGELQEILSKFNSRTVRAEILDVLMKTRKCPIKEARAIKTLLPSEVALVLQKFE